MRTASSEADRFQVFDANHYKKGVRMKKTNPVSTALVIAGGLAIIVGAITFFMLLEDLIELAVTSLVSCTILGLVLIGLAEIIKLLGKLVETTRATALNTKITAEAIAGKPKASPDELPSV